MLSRSYAEKAAKMLAERMAYEADVGGKAIFHNVTCRALRKRFAWSINGNRASRDDCEASLASFFEAGSEEDIPSIVRGAMARG